MANIRVNTVYNLIKRDIIRDKRKLVLHASIILFLFIITAMICSWLNDTMIWQEIASSMGNTQISDGAPAFITRSIEAYSTQASTHIIAQFMVWYLALCGVGLFAMSALGGKGSRISELMLPVSRGEYLTSKIALGAIKITATIALYTIAVYISEAVTSRDIAGTPFIEIFNIKAYDICKIIYLASLTLFIGAARPQNPLISAIILFIGLHVLSSIIGSAYVISTFTEITQSNSIITSDSTAANISRIITTNNITNIASAVVLCLITSLRLKEMEVIDREMKLSTKIFIALIVARVIISTTMMNHSFTPMDITVQ